MQNRKQKERNEALERLEAMSSSERKEAESVIADTLEGVPEFKRAESFMLYVSDGHEVDTHGLIRRLIKSGKQVSVPRANPRTGGLEAVRILDFDRNLEPGYAGIPEPVDGLDIIAPDSIDIVIVPLVAFGADCRRLGRGKGFYDRFLKSLSPDTLAVGLAFESQKSGMVPEDEHDMRLDMVVSEKRIYKK